MTTLDSKNPKINPLAIALTIAGSDSGGGAGIQADLKTFFALGVHGTSVLTAITAQNTSGVSAWQPVSSDLVMQQLDAVTTDFCPGALKTGMLADAGLISSLAEHLSGSEIPMIIDPVLVASSGDALATSGTVHAYIDYLAPLAALITPNHPEAEALTGLEIRNATDSQHAADKLLETGCGAVLIKGGHGTEDIVEDLLVTRSGSRVFSHRRLEGVYHGTGCTLSAAITANIALGNNLEEAVAAGIDLVCHAMEDAVQAGRGTLRVLHIPQHIS